MKKGIKICNICKKEYLHYRKTSKFCSNKCFGIYKKTIPPWNKGKKGLNPESYRRGKYHTSWKGGRYIKGGYVYVNIPDHPYKDQDSYVAEHRYVMERTIGRYLKKGEIVHHKNGIKTDNRPENLVLTVFNMNWHPCHCPKCGFDFLIK